MAVVDRNFRVHGAQNLRVVDASVFRRIPGYYVMLPIMTISEKASDVILS
jgi:choline dehydrogenase